MRCLLLVAALLTGGCMYDFDAYTPVAGDASNGVDSGATPGDTGAPDSGPLDTGPVDTGCAPPDAASACYATVKTCAATCADTRVSCEAMCSNPGCRKNCVNNEGVCRDRCVSDCTACTTAEGCAAPAPCRAALP